jgi:signal peptidase I
VRLVDRATRVLPQPWRSIIDWLLTIAIAVAVVLAFEAEVAKPYRVPSSSMEPTLHCAKPAAGCAADSSDRVIACRICYRFESPKRGEIVVFNTPPAAARGCGTGGVYVKRMIGLPGDRVHEDAEGFIWIDGKRLSEPYISATRRLEDTTWRNHTWLVPPGEYFMLGDNRGGSCDSRTWGAVPRSDLIGPVEATYWPPDRISIR